MKFLFWASLGVASVQRPEQTAIRRAIRRRLPGEESTA